MKFIKLLRVFAIAVAVSGLGMPAQAAMLSTTEMQAAAVSADLVDVSNQRGWIESQLQLGGVEAAEASQRVAAMTDAEVRQLYQRIDEAPAGAADFLVIALVIFVVLEITGYIDVIPEQ